MTTAAEDALMKGLEEANASALADLDDACLALGLERGSGVNALEAYPARLILHLAQRVVALEAEFDSLKRRGKPLATGVFEMWAVDAGGLQPDSARSYVSYLRSVELSYGIDLDGGRGCIAKARQRLTDDNKLNDNTRRNRLSALQKYETFCSAAGRR